MRHNTTFSIIFVQRFTKRNRYGYVNTHANKYIGNGCDSCVPVYRRTKVMKEQAIERKLVEEVKKMGGFCPKFVSPGWDGVPDRMVLMPGGRIAFVELKAPGRKMRPIQLVRKRQMEGLGFKVFCIDNMDQIGGLLDEVCTL